MPNHQLDYLHIHVSVAYNVSQSFLGISVQRIWFYILQFIKFLASDPTCDKENRANEVGAMEPRIQLTCRLKYWGNWAPIMEWKRLPIGGSDDKNFPLMKEGVLNKSYEYSVESTLEIRGRQDIGVRYVCITRFAQSQRSGSSGANNIPIYSYKWEYIVQSKRQFLRSFSFRS